MANSLAFGLLVATALILILVPTSNYQQQWTGHARPRDQHFLLFAL